VVPTPTSSACIAPTSAPSSWPPMVRGLALPDRSPGWRNPLQCKVEHSQTVMADRNFGHPIELQRCGWGLRLADGQVCQPIRLCGPSVIAGLDTIRCCTARGGHSKPRRFSIRGLRIEHPNRWSTRLAGAFAGPSRLAAAEYKLAITAQWTNRLQLLHVPRGLVVAGRLPKAGIVVTQTHEFRAFTQ